MTKNTFLIILFYSLISSSFAQITINKPVIDYSAKVTVEKYTAADSDSSIGALASLSGEKKMWDMSYLPFEEKTFSRKTEFSDGSLLKGVSEFKDISLIVSETFADTVRFSLYNLTDSVLYSVAELSNKKDTATLMDLVYDPPVITAVFPFTFGTTRTFNSTVHFGDFNMTLAFEMKADGWGELITPAGKYKVLRVKLGGTGEFIGQQISVNNYLFLTEKHIILPVAEIQEIVYSGVATYSASYRKFY